MQKPCPNYPGLLYKIATHWNHLISSCHLYRPHLSNRIHLVILTKPTMNTTCLLNWKTSLLLYTRSRVTPSKAALFWTWLVWIRWMAFPQPCPIQLMWTAWPHVMTCSQWPQLFTSPLVPSPVQGYAIVVWAPPPFTVLLPWQRMCFLLLPRQ